MDSGDERQRFFNYLLQQKFAETDENGNVGTDSHRSFRSLAKTLFGTAGNPNDRLEYNSLWSSQTERWFRGLPSKYVTFEYVRSQ